ncbi:MAG: hypothetical protein H5U14_16380, partial [Roseovarius sp.]|nr:hypothetical protein [Roseovarius sp.]
MDLYISDPSPPPGMAPLHQQPHYARVLTAMGVVVQTLRATQDGQPRAQAQVVRRR